MSYLDPTEFVTKMVDQGESKDYRTKPFTSGQHMNGSGQLEEFRCV